jgi:hypothetical protein
MSFYSFFREKLANWGGAKKRPDPEQLLSAIPAEALDVPDDMEPTFPLELQVEAVPLSFKASPESRNGGNSKLGQPLTKYLIRLAGQRSRPFQSRFSIFPTAR